MCTFILFSSEYCDNWEKKLRTNIRRWITKGQKVRRSEGQKQWWPTNLIKTTEQIHVYLFLLTRYILFTNACYNLSSKSKLLWSYPVKPTLIIQGIINIYKQYFTTIYQTLFHNYFSIYFCILLSNTLFTYM